MGCPGQVTLGDSLVFSVCTHNPDTGILTDADAAPSYRVYENETDTPILTGTMAKLDDANTTGLYAESIDCTAGNGFEAHKSYNVYIEATVAGSKGGISYAFKITDKEGYLTNGFNAAEFDYTITNSQTSLPIADVRVWVSTDIAGNNVIASGLTNSFGVMIPKPKLTAGTYYFWRQKDGIDFTDPDTEIVT